MENKNAVMVFVWILVGAAIIIIVLSQNEKRDRRIANPKYAYGTVTGKSKVAKGEQYLDYIFVLDNVTYKGSVSIKFCLECKESCCEAGKQVIVRYTSGDPSNNDLVHSLDSTNTNN